MRRRRLWIIVVVLIVIVLAVVLGVRRLLTGADEDAALFFDRTWMTEIPEDRTEFVHGLVALEEHGIGAFFKASSYRLEEEIFEHEPDGRGLKIRFPQTGRRARFTYQVRRCDDHPPFDLCLTLSRNPWGGPRQLFGYLDEDEAGSRSAVRRLGLEPLPGRR